MVSRIGSPVTDPAIVQIKLATADASPAESYSEYANDITADYLRDIPSLVEDFVGSCGNPVANLGRVPLVQRITRDYVGSTAGGLGIEAGRAVTTLLTLFVATLQPEVIDELVG